MDQRRLLWRFPFWRLCETGPRGRSRRRASLSRARVIAAGRGTRGRTAREIAAVLLLMGMMSPAWVPAHALSFPLLRHDDKQHKEIESLEAEWRGALIRNDESTLNRLLADDYLGVNPDGMLETKADALAVRRSGAFKITRIDPDNVKVHVYGDTAVVSSVVDVDGQEGDRDIGGRYHYTRVYRKRGGSWKVVSFEASRLQNGRKR